jgi:hypothetical protein
VAWRLRHVPPLLLVVSSSVAASVGLPASGLADTQGHALYLHILVCKTLRAPRVERLRVKAWACMASDSDLTASPSAQIRPQTIRNNLSRSASTFLMHMFQKSWRPRSSRTLAFALESCRPFAILCNASRSTACWWAGFTYCCACVCANRFPARASLDSDPTAQLSSQAHGARGRASRNGQSRC